MGWELAGVLGAAAGHSITLVSLDVASCEIGDRGCAALCTALLHGTAGVGGLSLAFLGLANNKIKDAGATLCTTRGGRAALEERRAGLARK